MGKVRNQSSLAGGLLFAKILPFQPTLSCSSCWGSCSAALILGRTTKLQLLPPLNGEQLTSSGGLGISFFWTQSPSPNQPLVSKKVVSVASLFKTYLGCQASLSARAFLQLLKLCYMSGKWTLMSWSFCGVWGREVLISLPYRWATDVQGVRNLSCRKSGKLSWLYWSCADLYQLNIWPQKIN